MASSSFTTKSVFLNCLAKNVLSISLVELFSHLPYSLKLKLADKQVYAILIPVGHLKRSKRHKIFDSIAEYGKTSVGWFFGLKLHIVANDLGQLLAFKITQGSRSDSQEAVLLLKGFKGLAFGDKGYLGKKIFEELMQGGLKLITRKRKNMKEKQELSSHEKQLLNQRGIIETVIGHLKHCYQVWHTRHRSIINAMTHLVAALAAYAIEPLKLSVIKLLSNCNLQTHYWGLNYKFRALSIRAIEVLMQVNHFLLLSGLEPIRFF